MIKMGKLKRAFVLLLFTTFSVVTASALSLSVDETTVCPGSALLLTATGGTSNGVLTYYKSDDNKTWTILKQTRDTKSADDMDNTAHVYYYVQDKMTKVVSNVITVTRNDNAAVCGKTCHISSTGEYYSGTDFDPVDPTNASSAKIPSDVINYFDENGVGCFTSGGLGSSAYHITNDLSKFFGNSGITPALDSTNKHTNYYYAIDQSGLNSPIITLCYPASDAQTGKSYRYTMRFYVYPGDANCTHYNSYWNGKKNVDTTICVCPCDGNRWTNTSINARTGQGRVTADTIEAWAYNDATGALLGHVVAPEEDVARVPFTTLIPNIGKMCGDLIRIEMVFYGKFPNPNGLSHFQFSAEFAQFECTSAKVAVDYVSADQASVCMSSGTVCVGTSTVINAAGFSRNADYRWDYYDPTTKTWERVVVGGIPMEGKSYSRITVTPTAVGKVKYRVYALNTKDTIPFTVTAKDCNPTPIDTIIGDTILCVPNAPGDTMTVMPIDANPNVSYHWTLTNIKTGKEISDNTVVYVNSSDRGTYTVLNIPDDPKKYPEGDYLLEVYMSKKDGGVDVTVGKHVQKTIHVIRRPGAKIILLDYSGNPAGSTTTLCPSSAQSAMAIDTVRHTEHPSFDFSWTHAIAKNAIGDTAQVTFGDDKDKACEGLLDRLQVTLQVSLKADKTCYSRDTNWYTVAKEVPASIKCSSLGSATQIYYANAKTDSATIQLPVPEVTGTCDPNPKIKITGSLKMADGTTTSVNIDQYLNDLKANAKLLSITLPATTSKLGKTGITLTYQAIDGCGKSELTCNITIVVRDTTPPNVDCNKIPNYLAHLTNQAGCEAVPGYYPTELPTLVNPVLVDQNNPKNSVIVTYEGRHDQWPDATTEPAKTPKQFTNPPALNDSFPVGYNFILWQFADNAGNVSYCEQKITVIDDKEPVLTNCKDTIMDVSVQRDDKTCGLSLDSLLIKLGADVPSATDVCSGEGLKLTAEYWYREEGTTSTAFTKVVDPKALILKLGKTYTIEWRFYKGGTSGGVDKTVFAKCDRIFNIVDSVPPITNCAGLNDTSVTVNQNTAGHVYEYASGASQGSFNKNTTYTLAGFFLNTWPTAYDPCEGTIEPVVTVAGPVDTKGTIDTVSISSPTLLQKHEFYPGLSTVIYTYTDTKGNKSYCTQLITVAKNIVLPCTDVQLAADANCKGILDISAAKLESATVSYIRYYKYKDYSWGFSREYRDVTSDDDKDSTITISDFWGTYDMPITIPGFNSLPTSNTLQRKEGNQEAKIYPYQVIKITNVDTLNVPTATSETTTVDNTSKLEELPYKLVEHRNYDGSMGATKLQVYKYISLETSSFPTEFTTDFKTFPEGRSLLIWKYTDAFGKDTVCKQVVVVTDTTAPKVTCGNWEKSLTVKADDKTCNAIVDLKKPTVTDLSASDNCTAADDIKITWTRTFNKVVTTDLTAPYEKGTTLVTWIITDAAGNKSYCKQNINVNDSTGPKVDCDAVLKNPLQAYADADCEAKPADMLVAGLKTPVLPASAEVCSPLTAPIQGVGVRSDAKDIFKDAYPKGNTTIDWSFTDASGNSTVCHQLIIVSDTTAPVSPDCDAIAKTPLTYILTKDQCSASKDAIKALLGKHYAMDNCDTDTIWGVPMLLNGTHTVALPESFGPGDYKIQWVFADKVGNQSFCTQSLSVKDTIAPNNDGVCPAPDSSMTADTKCALSYDDLKLPVLKINDKCDGVIEGVLSGDVMQPGTDGNPKIVYPSAGDFKNMSYYAGTVNHFVWTFTDKSGNKSQCKMTLTIKDGIAPRIENCTAGNSNKYAMSEGVCYAKWSDIDSLFKLPIAYDDCQELLGGNGAHPLTADSIRRYFNDTLISVTYPKVNPADTSWRKDPFPAGKTRLVWYFSDDAHNSDSCAKSVDVTSTTKPYFNCDSIKPNPIYPVAKKGECEVKFADITFGTYYAVNPCDASEVIKGTLHLGNSPYGPIVPDTQSLKSGMADTLYWVFQKKDGNYVTCPQYIVPSHSNPVDFDCSKLPNPITVTALRGECYIPSSGVPLTVPQTVDKCASLNGEADSFVVAVGSRADGLKLTDNYSTGNTIVNWTFVSKYNIKDTLVCPQTVFVKGNKDFDFVCDTVAPVMADTIHDCGTSVKLALKAPKVADPCVTDTVITGVATDRVYMGRDSAGKADSKNLKAPFSLGQTNVTWTFTDATGNIQKTCIQEFHVYTDKKMETPCDTADLPKISVKLDSGECAISADSVMKTLKVPYALAPCTGDTIIGHLQTPLSSLVQSGVHHLIWVFDGDASYMANPKQICAQDLQVGLDSSNAFTCESFPDIDKILAEDNCQIDFKELHLNVPKVIDNCPNGKPGTPTEIVPVIYRSSEPGKTYSAADTSSFVFKVGVVDTISWRYAIYGTDTVCKQIVRVRDSVGPLFDCSMLKPITAIAKGNCQIGKGAVLSEFNPWPTAAINCVRTSTVRGVPTLDSMKGPDGTTKYMNNVSLPDSFMVGYTYSIRWTFVDTATSIKSTICHQPVSIVTDLAPDFDCDSLSKDTIKVITTGCDTVLDLTLAAPKALDHCTATEIVGVPTRVDGQPITAPFYTGYTTIRWTFTSPYSTTPSVCHQTVWVRTSKEIDAHCGNTEYPDIEVDAQSGCTVPSTDILAKLNVKHSFEVPCNNAKKVDGVASRSDGKALADDYPVGQTIITWTFTGPSEYLANPVSKCEQTVFVGDKNKPLVDCPTVFPDTVLYLDKDNCSADSALVPVHLDSLPFNACTNERAVLSRTLIDGTAVPDSFQVGSSTIRWTFTFPTSNQKVFCDQKITVNDTIAPDFNCDSLKTVIVRLTSGQTVTYDQVKAAGFKIPVVTDKCCTVTTTTTRSDGKQMEDDYPLGVTVINFAFADNHGNVTKCADSILVTDMVPPTVKCPTWNGGNLNCISEVSTALPVYKNFAEFKAAGGTLVNSDNGAPFDETKLDTASFTYKDKISGNSCSAVFTRTYSIKTVRDMEYSCEKPITINVKDTIAPTYSGLPTTDSKITACNVADTILAPVTAKDECNDATGVTDKGKPGVYKNNRVTLTHTRVSTQDPDITKCAHYTYDIVHTWNAVDSCGNAAEEVKYTIHVVDTMKPDINLPADWNTMIHPTYLKNCEFGVPDITALLPTDSISEQCQEVDSLVIWQSPVAGTKIYNDASKDTTLKVYLYISDLCGNVDTLYKEVQIQSHKSIINLIIPNDTAEGCGADKFNVLFNLTSVRTATGVIWKQDYDGSWVSIAGTFLYDCYRDSLAESHLIYSNNPTTYGNRYRESSSASRDVFNKYNVISRRTQSGKYIYVAMDTVSGCTDTASVILNVRERPRVQLESGRWNLCDGNALDLNGSFGSAFSHCVQDMGTPVTSQGWMLGDSVYKAGQPIAYQEGRKDTLLYYATNACGTSTSFNSLFADSCAGGSGDDGLTTADSLSLVGSQANLDLWRTDHYVPRDSVNLVVYPKYDASKLLLTTEPQDKARVWEGDDAELHLTSPYESYLYMWFKVNGTYDGAVGVTFDENGKSTNPFGDDEDDELMDRFIRDTTKHSAVTDYNNYSLTSLRDSGSYYVLVGNGVCPAVATNLVSIDVMKQLPTAITPYTRDGLNDVFMKGHHVYIFNRYGQEIYEGSDGWDGYYRGVLADPGVYFYEVEMKNGVTHKGSVEVVKIK
jgi:hypothetical protein